MKEKLLEIYSQSFKDNWELPALTNYITKKTITYGEFAKSIARYHILFKECGIKQGDKIAILGKNTPEWIQIFFATITYGAVIVPVLNDFNPQDAQHIVNHSDSVLLFVSQYIWESIEYDKLPKVKAVFSLDNNELLAEHEESNDMVLNAVRNLSSVFNAKYRNGFSREDIKYPDVDSNALAVINYTSGTTGFSKGVMLSYNNLCGNVVYGLNANLHFRGSRCVSFLPLAHAYGCAFDMLVPLAIGTHITLLGKLPSPKILIKAMNEVRPNLVICVPLILEKIYRKQIVPMITKQTIRWALAIPFVDTAIYSQIRKKLIEAFGGNFEEIIVGGAPLNKEVEDFLHKIKFPFTVGYGMTECGPLISHTPWRDFIPTSSGRTLPGIMETKILSVDSENIPGEICVRGANCMQGYYKNQEATDLVLDEEGWLHTGDMGVRSADGTIYIKGRLKTMILSSNGQNIYPEEIESKLNNMPFVGESLVVERNNRLVALVYPDYEAMDANGIGAYQLRDVMEQVRKDLNKLVAPYEQIEKIQLIANEFEKTPKRSIKRYLYNA